MVTQISARLCKACEEQLPDVTPKQQKYCSLTCRERMKKRRQRYTREATYTSEFGCLRVVGQQFDQLQVEHRKLRKRLEARDLKIRRLQHALQRAEYQVEAAASEQALRTRAVRDELSMSQSQVATLKRNWSVRSVADDETVTKLRSDLATVTAEYNELATKYQQLTAAAKSAAEERKNLQGIVRQWDYLCKRLHVATKGRPRNDSDKKILAARTQFRRRDRK